MLDKKQEIMIIDDEVVNLSVLSEILKPMYTVSVFKSGLEALAQIEKGKKPDLILLDINMPDLNGYEVLDRLYQDKRNKDIPVIIITIMDTVLEEEKGLSKGAVDFICDRRELREKIAKVLAMLQRQPADAVQ